MVQEFHILRCFSCETFQSHIVKKTNKWECKVCGVKQSVKKVYGRGSGKDCRIHTQKLNALRGQKEETESPDQRIKEISKAERPVGHLSTNDHPSFANPSNVFKRTSKWAEFVDENGTGITQNDFNKPEPINFIPIITYKSKAQKRKMRDEFDNKEVEGYFDDVNSVDDNYSMLSNKHYSGYRNKIKFNKCNAKKDNSYKNNNVDSDNNSQAIYRRPVEKVNNACYKNQNNIKHGGKWGGYLESKDENNLLKTPSQNTTNIRQKNAIVSLKWAKYLEEEEDLSSAGTFSMKTSTNHQLEREVGVSIKKITYHEDCLQEGRDSDYSGTVTSDHIRSLSSDGCGPMSPNDFELRSYKSEIGQDISNPIEKLTSDHFVSSSKLNFNWSLNGANCSASTSTNTVRNSFAFDSDNLKKTNTSRDDLFKNKFIKEDDNSFEKVITKEENLNSKTISLPVFEQSGELSDSDFQLDF